MSVLNNIVSRDDLTTNYTKAPKARNWVNFIAYLENKLKAAKSKPYPKAKGGNGFPKSFIRERAQAIENEKIGTATHVVKIPESNKPLPLSTNIDDVAVLATSLAEAIGYLAELVELIKSPSKNSVNSAVIAELEIRGYEDLPTLDEVVS